MLDNVFSGFELGDFAVLRGDASLFMLFVLSVSSQLTVRKGSLGSAVVFADGGNSFNPYIVAEIARSHGLDSRATLKNVYVSRAFTAYQFSTLILEKLEAFLRRKRARLLIVSDISSLYLDKDMPKTEAVDLFLKACTKLSEIAASRQTIVVTSYFPEKRSSLGVSFELILFERSNVLMQFKKSAKGLWFVLEDHPRAKPFSMEFPLEEVLNGSSGGIALG